jgi:hypothetical protein
MAARRFARREKATTRGTRQISDIEGRVPTGVMDGSSFRLLAAGDAPPGSKRKQRARRRANDCGP